MLKEAAIGAALVASQLIGRPPSLPSPPRRQGVEAEGLSESTVVSRWGPLGVVAVVSYSEADTAVDPLEHAVIMATMFNRLRNGEADGRIINSLWDAGVRKQTTGEGGGRPYASGRHGTGAFQDWLLEVASIVERAGNKSPLLRWTAKGATHYIHYETQLWGHKHKGWRHPDEIERRRTGGGLKRVRVRGISDQFMWLWAPA